MRFLTKQDANEILKNLEHIDEGVEPQNRREDLGRNMYGVTQVHETKNFMQQQTPKQLSETMTLSGKSKIFKKEIVFYNFTEAENRILTISGTSPTDGSLLVRPATTLLNTSPPTHHLVYRLLFPSICELGHVA